MSDTTPAPTSSDAAHERLLAQVAALPALLFPIGFLADLQYWLASFGTNLDPHAALSSSIKPFVPPVLGVGTIGQFKTVGMTGSGFWLATAAALTVLLDCPVAEGLARARGRAGASDRFERETIAFHERVRAGFHALAAGDPARFVVIDASAPIADVERCVVDVIDG